MDDVAGSDEEWLAVLANPVASIDFTTFGFGTLGPGSSLPQRVLDDHLMYLLTDGNCVGNAQGTQINLQPGSFMWMRPGLAHSLTMGTGGRPMTFYRVRFQFGPDAHEPRMRHHAIWQRHDAWDLLPLMDELMDELNTRMPYRTTRLRGLLTALCAGELRRQTADSPVRTLSRAQRQAVESYVRNQLPAWPTPKDLADHIQLSHDYFSRLFAQTFGQSPRRWLVEERARQAARLLTETVQTVTQIAAALGYDDVSFFSHQFKQVYGVSPRTYRRTQH